MLRKSSNKKYYYIITNVVLLLIILGKLLSSLGLAAGYKEAVKSGFLSFRRHTHISAPPKSERMSHGR